MRVGRIGLIVLFGLAVLGPARAQSLVEQYREARFRARATEIVREHGGPLAVRPAVTLPSFVDPLRPWLGHAPPREETPPVEEESHFEVGDWQLVRKFQRDWFRETYGETNWAYLGSNELSVLDTTGTQVLRARLEAQFGTPTQTLGDFDDIGHLGLGEIVQFEYWFVLNDSIPLLVMDVNGPFDRGLVVASDHRYREALRSIRDSFLGEIKRSKAVAPFVDYYYHYELKTWYRTGFDGTSYFLRRIPPPNLQLGRPYLDDSGR